MNSKQVKVFNYLSEIQDYVYFTKGTKPYVLSVIKKKFPDLTDLEILEYLYSYLNTGE